MLSLAAVLLALGAAGCRHTAADARILFLSNRDGGWALYAMNPDGSRQQRALLPGNVDPFGEGIGFGEPLVSPDGTHALIQRHGVTVVSLATGASRRLGAGEESGAAWSPSGSQVVFTGPQNRGLYVEGIHSRLRRIIFKGKLCGICSAASVFSPAWSPDGRWIAFGEEEEGGGETEVFAIHPDGSGLKYLTRWALSSDGGIAWSRDGKVAFMGTRRGSFMSLGEEFSHLVVVDTRTGRTTVLRSHLVGSALAWSPDGRRLAYAAAIGDSQLSSIFTVRPDGRGHKLTPSRPPYSDDSPVWSPDGKSLLFVRRPEGGGARRGIPEVWTMRADGSGQHPLTSAYPTGADNTDPRWFRGAVRRSAAPAPREARRGGTVVLRVPFPVDELAADGDQAAIAPVAFEMEQDVKPTPPVLLWRPGAGRPRRLVVSSCGGVHRLVLAGRRLALDCDERYFDQISQAVWVYDLRTRLPRELFYAQAGVAASDARGIYVDNLVGGGGLLAFGDERVNADGKTLRRNLWRVEGRDSVAVRGGRHEGLLVAAGGGRFALELAGNRVAILRASGERIRLIRLQGAGVGHSYLFELAKPPFLLSGRDLLFLGGRQLQAYDTDTGKLRWHRRVPKDAELESAEGGLVVYTAGSTIHLVSPGGESVVHTGAQVLHRLRYDVGRRLHAALTSNGLYYSFNVRGRPYPGRVVFVPRSALPH